jgi:uncharacterized glyoxalase superfamily protein PhnB
MLTNRSVPTETVLPHLYYDNLSQAVIWLNKVFGFIEHYRYGEPVQGAQMHLGNAWIMLGSTRPGRGSPVQLRAITQSLTVFVEDIDAHFNHAKLAGAKIVEELHETPYGERQYGAEDLEGHHWLFAKHVQDVDPAYWGATVCKS